MTSRPPTRVVREFSEAELALLSTMLRQKFYSMHADRLHADMEKGIVEAGALVTFPHQTLRSLVSITSHWFQTPLDNYHVFEIGTALPEAGFRVIDRDDGNWRVESGGHVQVGTGRRVLSIDVVSYEHEAYWADSGELAESLKYDRALVFDFDQGAPLTLTTVHGSISGAIEIRTGRLLGSDYDQGTFSTRMTLH